MSWPVTTYYCTKCDFRQGDAGTWGTREYVLPDGIRIPVNSALGWCAQCNAITAVESLDIGRREAELREAERELEKQGGQPVRRWWQIHRFLVPMFWRRDLANWYFFAGMVEDARAALQLITMRKSPPKCLACGSDEITTPLISDTSEWTDVSQPTRTGFIHPDCGGELSMVMDGLRIGLKPSVRRYTPEGILIEQEYVPGYTSPRSEYFDDREANNARIRNMGIGKPKDVYIPDWLRENAD